MDRANPLPERLTEAPSPGRVRTVLLDMGGVLLDLGPARGLPWGELDRRGRRALLEALGDGPDRPADPLTEADLDRLLFAPWRQGYERRYERGREEPWEPHGERLLAAAGKAGLDPLELWAGPFLETLEPLPGARRALERLAAAGYPLGLVSNVPLPGRLYRRALERHGLAEPFRDLRFSYDEGARKPLATLVQRGMEALGGEPATTLMVGDRRETDIAAGRAAGVLTAWLAGGSEGREDDRPHRVRPTWILGSVADLPELLGRP